MNFLLFLCRVIWEFPQNIIGIIYFFYLWKNDKIWSLEFINNKSILLSITISDILPFSLGIFTFYPNSTYINMKLLDRAIGYSLLSFITGPTYLFVISIPQIVWYFLKIKLCLFREIPYNSFYTERLSKYLGKR